MTVSVELWVGALLALVSFVVGLDIGITLGRRQARRVYRVDTEDDE